MAIFRNIKVVYEIGEFNEYIHLHIFKTEE